MGNILEDIKSGSNKIVQLFSLEKITMDYSIKSIIEIDRFFHKHSKDGKAVKKGMLVDKLGMKLFCLGAYVGETVIKNVPGSAWVPDAENPENEVNVSVKLPNGATIWPVQRMIKRFNEDSSESIYPYVYEVTKNFSSEPFDKRFWEIENEIVEPKKPWWKF